MPRETLFAILLFATVKSDIVCSESECYGPSEVTCSETTEKCTDMDFGALCENCNISICIVSEAHLCLPELGCMKHPDCHLHPYVPVIEVSMYQKI